MNETALFCRMCGKVSYNPEDVKNRYCGHCHVFHDNVALERWLAGATESMSALIRLAIRIYQGGVLQSVERIERTEDELKTLLPRLAERHATALCTAAGHIEIEFLDEPDVSKRFFRMGNDPDSMVDPVEVDPNDPAAALRKWGRKPQ